MEKEQIVMAMIRASRPSFRNAHDKVAFAVHATFLASGFTLNATGPSAFTDDALTSTPNEDVGIDHWNDFEDSYAFVYSKNEERPKRVLVKCLAMNDKLIIDCLAEGSSDPLHLEINVEDYNGDDGSSGYSSQFKDFGKLVSSLDKDIIAKLNGSSTTQTESSSANKGNRDHVNQPSAGVPYNPHNPFHRSGVVLPPIYPSPGGGDLFPGPGAGMFPTRGDFGGGSMLVGPADPRFFGGIGGDHGFPGGQPGVPPGARFDPYGPPGVPGFEPNRFIRNPRRPPGGTHPDLEHFGSGSDFI